MEDIEKQCQFVQDILTIFIYCIIDFMIVFTRYIGVALMSLSGLLLNLAGFLQFSWYQHEFAIVTCIFAGVVFLLSIISFVISGVLTWEKEHPHHLPHDVNIRWLNGGNINNKNHNL